MTKSAEAIVPIVHFMVVIVSLQATNLLAASTGGVAPRTGWLVVLSENQLTSDVPRPRSGRMRWNRASICWKRRSPTWGDRGPTVSEAGSRVWL
jgi:hypothetical protein